MMRTSPVMAFTGTPIYNFYLRAMGAKIGRNAVISCRCGPVCADLLSHRRRTRSCARTPSSLGYRAQSNFIHIGPVEIGSQRLCRRSERDRYRHRHGRQHPARPRLLAAERPARAGRQALSRLARDRDHLGLLPDREHGYAARCAASSTPRSNLRRCSLFAVPAPILALSFLGAIFRRRRRGRRDLDADAARRLRGLVLRLARGRARARSMPCRACAWCS